MVNNKLTDEEFDDYIHEMFILAEIKRFDEMPDIEPKLSLKYQKKFAKMLADPLGYAKRSSLSSWRYMIKYVLVAVVLLFIFASMVFTGFQTQIMANNMWAKNHKDYTTIHFINRAKEIVLPKAELCYVPEGFNIVFEDEILNVYKKVRYENEDNQWFFFHITTANDYYLSIDQKYNERKHIKLDNGIEALFFQSISDNKPRYILWSSVEGKITFVIYGTISEEDLLTVANGIKIE